MTRIERLWTTMAHDSRRPSASVTFGSTLSHPRLKAHGEWIIGVVRMKDGSDTQHYTYQYQGDGRCRFITRRMPIQVLWSQHGIFPPVGIPRAWLVKFSEPTSLAWEAILKTVGFWETAGGGGTLATSLGRGFNTATAATATSETVPEHPCLAMASKLGFGPAAGDGDRWKLICRQLIRFSGAGRTVQAV